jgi:hypothetical protein
MCCWILVKRGKGEGKEDSVLYITFVQTKRLAMAARAVGIKDSIAHSESLAGSLYYIEYRR